MEIREDLIFNRSNKGKKTKYDEAMKILEYSVMMVQFFEIKEFNNVIAGQLRLILCDTFIRRGILVDNSLIRKVNDDPQLYPISDNFVELDNRGNAFIAGELFDYSKPKIDLTSWLNQVILKINLQDKQHNITIFDFIKESANKSGGAHVDASLPEKSFIVDVHSERVLCDIAKGFFKSIGRDFNQKSLENFTHIMTTIEQAKASN